MRGIQLREFYERIIDERDRQYEQRFRAAEITVSAGFDAQEKAVAAAFIASEKAVVKAEDAQRDYNIRSNEFRAQLGDQAKNLMPRTETLGLFKATDEKLLIVQSTHDNKIEAVRTTFEKNDNDMTKALADLRLAMSRLLSIDIYETGHIELQRQVNELRESRSEGTGKSVGMNVLLSYIIAAAGVALAVVFHFVK